MTAGRPPISVPKIRTHTTWWRHRSPVRDAGPYPLIRHPGYLGSLLTWVGFALTSRRVPVVALIAGVLGVAYGRRIAAEGQLLRRDLHGYTTYSERTKKLSPFV
ncbi:MAG: methyltransferase family protein [Mycobacteriales bacterium]